MADDIENPEIPVLSKCMQNIAQNQNSLQSFLHRKTINCPTPQNNVEKDRYDFITAMTLKGHPGKKLP